MRKWALVWVCFSLMGCRAKDTKNEGDLPQTQSIKGNTWEDVQPYATELCGQCHPGNGKVAFEPKEKASWVRNREVLLDVLESGRMPPRSNLMDDKSRAALLQFLYGLDPDANLTTCAETSVPARMVLLTQEQLFNTWKRALPDVGLPQDVTLITSEENERMFLKKFSNDQNRMLSNLSAHYYIADAVARQAAPRLAKYGSSETKLRELLEKLTRKPALNEDVNKLKSLLGMGDTLGWARVIVTLGLSPSVIYRVEKGGSKGLDNWERAELLSYTLTDAPPDAQLMLAARNNALSKDDEIRAQVLRLWNATSMDGGSKENTAGNRFKDKFFRNLLGIQESQLPKPLDGVDYEGVILPAQWKEWQGFLALNTTVENIFKSSVFPLTPELSRFYNVPETNGNADLSTFGRKGILSTGIFSSAHGKPTAPIAIHRGLVILTRLLCQEFTDPKAVMRPPVEDDHSKTWRERLTLVTDAPSCKQCHDFINPPSFISQSFDGYGRRFERSATGLLIDTSSPMSFPDGAYNNLSELTQKMANLPEVKQCIGGYIAGYVASRLNKQTQLCGRESSGNVQSGNLQYMSERALLREMRLPREAK